MYRYLRIWLPIAAATAVAFVGCSADNSDTGDGPGGSSATSTSTSGTGAGGGTSSGTGGAGAAPGGFNPGTGGGGGGETCLATEAEAKKQPLDMLVVLDRSGSMGSKWGQSVSALSDFFNDPASAGVGVAMNFFPIDGQQDTCNPNHYNPPHVDLGQLNAYAPTLIAAMSGQTAMGPNTPMYGALHGSYQWATGYQDANLDHVVIVVFASDGQPNSCPGNQNDASVIAGLAQSAFNYNGLRTFVIAIQGSNVTQLNQIAAAGGTGQAYDVTSDTTLFKQKMEEIRAQVLGCEYLIPDPGQGNEFDPTKVNVNYTPGGSSNPQTIPQANDEADCGSGPGWYYDDNTNPTKIFLCPGTCQQVETDGGAKIDFLFGCPTQVN